MSEHAWLADSSAQDSRLCLACGFCCNGVLHGKARLLPQEMPFAESLGLSLHFTPEQPTFRLPCPCWQNGCCSVYPVRPNVCGGYRCKLLLAVDAGEVTMEAALQHVAQAKQLVAEIEAIIGDSTTTDSIWSRVQRFAEQAGCRPYSSQFARAYPALKLKTSSLHWLLKRHFHKDKVDPILPISS